MTFGDRLRLVRWEKRVKLRVLSAMSGIEEGYICKLERGDAVPSVMRAASLARALGVGLDALLVGVDQGWPALSQAGQILHRMAEDQTESSAL